MGQLTLQIIEGLEAGRVHRDLNTPIHIGREEDNHVQLNDERVSRFHAKIQADSGRFILTDLESTNGTRVNGHPIQTRTLRPGDQISIGRCLLVVGAPEVLAPPIPHNSPDSSTSDAEDFRTAFPSGPPELPESLSALQAAQFSDVLEYIRTEMTYVLRGIAFAEGTGNEHVPLSRDSLHHLQQLPAQISRYLETIAQPGE